ncbi:MAG: metallophosphatase [Archangium gephyra]|uniref:Metallophosphatase n=1 Tax=Archangium gephyra TaxID=48 RepID=A0A2W5TB29_9BACT|nr:MAG: metallophosphatase [Archangium gephyra]
MTLSRRTLLLGGITSVVAHAARNEYGFEKTEVEVIVPGLDPAHDGLKVAQLSDFHVGSSTPERRVLGAVATLNEVKPDFVALTGDFVTYTKKPMPLVSSQLAGIEAPTIAVLGNHDHFVDATGVTKAVDKAGYATLRNQNTVLRLRGVDFTVVGVDDGGTGHDDVKKSLEGVRGSRMVLTHNPITARKLPKHAGLFAIAGHTHGGQIIIEPVTDALSKLFGQPYIRGRYDVGGNLLYVNRGLGFGRSSDLFHHLSIPELTVFTLRAPEAFPGIGV